MRGEEHQTEHGAVTFVMTCRRRGVQDSHSEQVLSHHDCTHNDEK